MSLAEADALRHVAGYTVVNDVSDRSFKPNPGRAEREKDSYFDWLHGKWHDTFCPMGPCVLPAQHVPDPHPVQARQPPIGADVPLGIDHRRHPGFPVGD